MRTKRGFLRPSWAALLAASLALAGGGSALASTSGLPLLRRLAGGTSADSVAVFGPRRFGTPAGGSAYHVERFALLASPTARYSLRVANGAPDGSARLDSARVVLNGAAVYSGADVRAASGALSRAVVPQGENTIEVHAYGPAGAYLTLGLVQAPDPSYAVFHRLYRRQTSAPVTEVVRFHVPPTAASPYRVRIANGNPDGTERVSSCTVLVNGVPVVVQNDVNQQVGALEREVTLRPGENVVEVTLSAKPSGHLNFWITATDDTPPALRVDAPAAGLVTREAQVQAAGRVDDETPTRVTVNGVEAARSGEGFSATVPLATEGENRLVFSATDAAGLRTDSVRTVVRDTEAPVITLAAPAEGVLTRDSLLHVRGTIRDRTAVKANLNGVALTLDADGAFEAHVPVPAEGANFLAVGATDAAGNSATLARSVTRDTRAPAVAFTLPAEGALTRQARLAVEGTVADESAVTVTVNGVAMEVAGNRVFRGEVPLEGEGRLALAAVATDAAGNRGEATRSVVRDTTPPVVTVEAPAGGAVTREAQSAVRGRVADASPVTLRIGGAEVPVAADGTFAATVPLAAEGENTLRAEAADAAGNTGAATVAVVRDTEAPVVAITSPADGSLTGRTSTTVTGTVQDRTAVRVSVAGVEAAVDASGAFSAEVPLGVEGSNALRADATDAAGNTAAAVVAVRRDTEAPVITVTSPEDGASTRDSTVAVAGVVRDASPVTLALDGAEAAVDSAGAFRAMRALSLGANALALVARDAAGNEGRAALAVTRTAAPSGPDLPPDPAATAPALDRTVASSTAASTAFLYSGPSPLQTGVAPGAVDPVRASAVRGRVLDRELKPLGGVAVTVAGRPELGRTLTRADGRFDLAVNGGGQVSFGFARDGYLPARRAAEVAWGAYTTLDDVILLRPDSAATVVTFGPGADAQVARGSVAEDADGPRQATLLFAPGTEAVLRLPDGTTRPAGSLTLRATEYTVGETGRQSMPAPLPPATAYTYAVDLAADEAVAAGATVELTKAPVLYVENFLGFPVGTPVPVGTFSPAAGAWVPRENGRVIRVLGVQGGAAQIDATGDGQADSGAQLAAIGVTPAELEQIAGVYAPGAELWRAPVTTRRLEITDLNWPRRVLGDHPAGSAAAECRPALAGAVDPCALMAAGASAGVVGTPYAVHYRSDRAAGHEPSRTLEITLTRDTIDARLLGVELVIDIAGRRFEQRFAPAPGLRHTFTWDGRDAFGRVVQGGQPVEVRIGYTFPVGYQMPPSMASSFGSSCDGTGSTSGSQYCAIRSDVQTNARRQETLWQTLRTSLGTMDPRPSGMGGFTLSAHHTYDPQARVLYTGDGRRRAGEVSNGVSTTPGIGIWVGLAAGPDGSVYTTGQGVVLRRDPGGRVQTVAGSFTPDYGCATASGCGDGKPAAGTVIVNWGDRLMVQHVAVGPDGSVYFTTPGRVRRVGPDGMLSTVAGTGGYGISPDGTPALQAQFRAFNGLAVGPDGALYVGTNMGFGDVVRRVGADGALRTVVGGGGDQQSEGRIAARSAYLGPISGLRVTADGSLFVAHGGRIDRVTPDGILTRTYGCAAYWNPCGPDGKDGRLASKAPTNAGSYVTDDITGMDVGPDGSIYFTTSRWYNDGGGGGLTAGRLRRIRPDGILTTLAGRDAPYDYRFSRYNDAPLRMDLHPSQVAVAPDGAVYFSDLGTLQRYGAQHPGVGYALIPGAASSAGVGNGEYRIASESGGAVFHFDASGRHLRTTHAVTGDTLVRFAYDAGGRLSAVTDLNGQTTRIERDAAGQALAIVSPKGERTAVEVDASGDLRGITNPARETTRFAYGAGGVLTGTTDAEGHTRAFAYDAQGRLAGRSGPDAASLTQTRTVAGSEQQFALGTGMGRTAGIGVQPMIMGERNVGTLPSGQRVVSEVGADGSTVTVAPDGTRTTVYRVPDARFGMQAPTHREEVRTPGGLVRTTLTAREVTTPDANDPLGVTRQTETVTINGRSTRHVFDRATNLVTTTTAAGRTSIVLLDAAGRVVEQRTPGLATMTNRYDAEGRLWQTAQGTRTRTMGHDSSGRVEWERDPLGRTTHYAYGASGRVTAQTMSGGQLVGFRYDGAGNLTGVTPPTRPEHAFGYTAANLRKDYTPPVLDGTPVVTRYRYNDDRQMWRLERPDGVAVETAFDAFGRAQSVTFGGTTLGFTYDAATGQVTATTRSDGVGLSYGYDGALPTRFTWTGPVAGTLGIRYDNDFRVAAQMVNADSVAFRYDADGLLTGAGALTITRDAQNGLPTGTALGGVTTSQAFNEYGERRSISAAYNGSTLLLTTYTRDASGRIETLTELIGGATTTYAYDYDTAGRLKEVRRDGAVVAAYEYDGNGNRKRVTTPTGVVEAAIDMQDRLTTYGEASYGYTAAGELAYKAEGADTTRYRYDALGNLLEVVLPAGTRIEYVVDAESRRVGRKVDGRMVQGWLWEGSLRPVAELDSTGVVVARFVYGERPNVPEYMVRGGRTYRLVLDHLGSVRLVVDVATGEVMQRIGYDAYGQVVENTQPGFQPFGYAGGIYDAATSLVRLGARDYDPRVGRWTAKDPIGFEGGDFGLYTYVGGDAINRVDPTGTYSISEFVQAHGGAQALSIKMAINFTGGCGSSVGSNLTGNWLVGASNDPHAIAKGCVTSGITSVLGFLGGGYLAGAAGSKLTRVGRYTNLTMHFSKQTADDIFETAAFCFLGGSQASWNEVAGVATGSPFRPEDIAAGQVAGCVGSIVDKVGTNPIKTAIYGALIGSTVDFFLGVRDVLDDK